MFNSFLGLKPDSGKIVVILCSVRHAQFDPILQKFEDVELYLANIVVDKWKYKSGPHWAPDLSFYGKPNLKYYGVET